MDYVKAQALHIFFEPHTAGTHLLSKLQHEGGILGKGQVGIWKKKRKCSEVNIAKTIAIEDALVLCMILWFPASWGGISTPISGLKEVVPCGEGQCDQISLSHLVHHTLHIDPCVQVIVIKVDAVPWT